VTGFQGLLYAANPLVGLVVGSPGIYLCYICLKNVTIHPAFPRLLCL
jgi:hypothetical protein